VDLHGDLVQLAAVGPGVVAAEQQIRAARKDNANVSLGAATVTAIGGSENRSRSGNGTSHAYPQQSVVHFASGRSSNGFK
jgi:hypothetical protein